MIPLGIFSAALWIWLSWTAGYEYGWDAFDSAYFWSLGLPLLALANFVAAFFEIDRLHALFLATLGSTATAWLVLLFSVDVVGASLWPIGLVSLLFTVGAAAAGGVGLGALVRWAVPPPKRRQDPPPRRRVLRFDGEKRD